MRTGIVAYVRIGIVADMLPIVVGDIVVCGMTSNNANIHAESGTISMPTNTAMRTNCIVGLGALSFVLFQRAVCELQHIGPAAANLTTLTGMLVAAVLAWRIHQPD